MQGTSNTSYAYLIDGASAGDSTPSGGNGQNVPPAAQARTLNQNLTLLSLPAEILIDCLSRVNEDNNLLLISRELRESAYVAYKNSLKEFIESLTPLLIQARSIRTAEERESLPQVTEAYLKAWKFLLIKPLIFNNQEQTSRLIEILFTLQPHISNVEEHISTLFPHGFPSELFKWLATVHLEKCLQIVVRHFHIHEGSPAYQFIIEHCPEDSINLKGIRRIQNGYCKSFLLNAVQNLYSCQSDEEDSEEEDFSQQYFELIKRLLQQDTECNATDQEGRTPLMLACMNEDKELISLLIQQPGIAVDVRDELDRTALEHAIISDNLTIVQALLEHPNVNINAIDRMGLRPLNLAIGRRQLPIIQFLLQRPTIDLNLNRSVDLEIMNIISNRPIEGNIGNNPNIARLYHAIEHDQIEELQNLLHKLPLGSKEDRYVLIYAFLYGVWKWKGKKEKISVFWQKLESAQKKDFMHQTLDYVIKHYNTEYSLIKFLVQKNIDFETNLNASENVKIRMLHAITSNDLPAIQSLLKEIRSETPIFFFNYAILSSNDEVINSFLEGMNQDEQNKFILAAFDFAAENGPKQVTDILTKRYGIEYEIEEEEEKEE